MAGISTSYNIEESKQRSWAAILTLHTCMRNQISVSFGPRYSLNCFRNHSILEKTL